MEASYILIKSKNLHIGPEALYIGQIRWSDVFCIDCYTVFYIYDVIE
jgi:hypothetical protein